MLGTERHESVRIDNQLRGRSGRQGDAGASVYAISLEDKMFNVFGSDKMGQLSFAFEIAGDSEEIKVQAPFNSGSLGVCVMCGSLYAVDCISRRSCPSLSRKHGRDAEIARRE